MPRPTWISSDKPALQKLWNSARHSQFGWRERLTPDDVVAACNELCELFPDAENAGGHIVLSDFNTETDFIGKCIRNCIEELGTPKDRHAVETIHFLSCLVELDDEERIVHV